MGMALVAGHLVLTSKIICLWFSKLCLELVSRIRVPGVVMSHGETPLGMVGPPGIVLVRRYLHICGTRWVDFLCLLRMNTLRTWIVS